MLNPTEKRMKERKKERNNRNRKEDKEMNFRCPSRRRLQSNSALNMEPLSTHHAKQSEAFLMAIWLQGQYQDSSSYYDTDLVARHPSI
jgi:hypothetical protein